MLTFPPERAQGDGKGDYYSEATAIDFRDDPGDTRQEFVDEADVNTLMRRYAATGGMMEQRQPQHQEIDWDVDLQEAIHAVQIAQRAYNDAPDHVRDRYRDWKQMIAAAEAGIDPWLEPGSDEDKALEEKRREEWDAKYYPERWLKTLEEKAKSVKTTDDAKKE